MYVDYTICYYENKQRRVGNIFFALKRDGDAELIKFVMLPCTLGMFHPWSCRYIIL